MFNCRYSNKQNRAQVFDIEDNVAIVPDDVYLSSSASSTDDNSDESRMNNHGVQNGADTTPQPLTDAFAIDATDIASTKAFIASAAEDLNQDINSVFTSARFAGRTSAHELMDCAAWCAQVVAAVLHGAIHELGFADQCDIINIVAPVASDEANVKDRFWPVLNAMLCNYLLHFSEPDWVPLPGIGMDDDTAPSMPVWETPDGFIVCDVVTAWGTEEALDAQVRSGLRLAEAKFGDRLSGVRLTPPLGFYMARWYDTDGSWDPLFEFPGIWENGQPV